MDEVSSLFLAFSSNKLLQMSGYIRDCLNRLSEEQIWRREAAVQNSLGNLVLHLCGNVRQWIGAYVGGLEDIRNRPLEFSEAGKPRDELLALLGQTVDSAVNTLNSLDPARLSERVPVQDGKITSVLEAIYQVVGHFQQHTGQIIYATKLWTGEDLHFYQPPSSGSIANPR